GSHRRRQGKGPHNTARIGPTPPPMPLELVVWPNSAGSASRCTGVHGLEVGYGIRTVQAGARTASSAQYLKRPQHLCSSLLAFSGRGASASGRGSCPAFVLTPQAMTSSCTARYPWSIAASVYAYAAASELAMVIRPNGWRASAQGSSSGAFSGSHRGLYS